MCWVRQRAVALRQQGWQQRLPRRDPRQRCLRRPTAWVDWRHLLLLPRHRRGRNWQESLIACCWLERSPPMQQQHPAAAALPPCLLPLGGTRRPLAISRTASALSRIQIRAWQCTAGHLPGGGAASSAEPPMTSASEAASQVRFVCFMLAVIAGTGSDAFHPASLRLQPWQRGWCARDFSGRAVWPGISGAQPCPRRRAAQQQMQPFGWPLPRRPRPRSGAAEAIVVCVCVFERLHFCHSDQYGVWALCK